MGKSGLVHPVVRIVRICTPFADHTALFKVASLEPIFQVRQYCIPASAILAAPVAIL